MTDRGSRGSRGSGAFHGVTPSGSEDARGGVLVWLVLLPLLQFFIPGVDLRESQDGGSPSLSPSPWWALLPLAAALLVALLLVLRHGASRP